MRRAAVVAVLLATACRGGSREEARAAVRTYLDRLVEAYRTSDESLVDPLVSEQQALKLVGLIGVKRDTGIVLDARLLELRFTRTEREGDGWVVETEERWRYRDRRIGTGEQVGEESTDRYAMRYRLSRRDGRWILEDLSFAAEPVVGRSSAPVPTDVRVMHGLPAGEAGAPPGPARGAGRAP